MRTKWSKGKRSRNKATVGEPAVGSLHICCYSIYSHYSYYNNHFLIKQLTLFNKNDSDSLSLSLIYSIYSNRFNRNNVLFVIKHNKTCNRLLL